MCARLSGLFEKPPLSFVKRKGDELTIVARNRHRPSQREKIAELLEEDEFLLIIFDACRFDYFEETYASYYTGDLQTVYTTNTYTKQYQQTTWPDEYDLTYVAGGPVISDKNFELSDLSYRPSEHFAEIIHAWDMGFEKELGVTPPEAVTEVALECNAPRMLVHYFQPHAPYIGDVRLRNDPVDEATSPESKIETRVESLKEIYDRIESGEIDEGTLREAYVSNLERVMEAAKPLVDEYDRRTAITSDHGELLGEDGRYLHGGFPHPILCELPWLEVDDTVGDVTELETDMTEAESDRSVKKQLQDLGYM